MLIEVGDLSLGCDGVTKQERLYNAVREKIVKGLWPHGGRLPATRFLANELSIGRNTVIVVYEQLQAEGYITSRAGAGYYVCVSLPEYDFTQESKTKPTERPTLQKTSSGAFVPGVPDLTLFPLKLWQKYTSRYASGGLRMLTNRWQGNELLRSALRTYLATSRSVTCDADQIIITNGAQHAITAILAHLKHEGYTFYHEQPGYAQVSRAASILNLDVHACRVNEAKAWELDDTIDSKEKSALYITPSNQYPLGQCMSVEQRYALLNLVGNDSLMLIEDDYDSEFQFDHQPFPSLQGLASSLGLQDNIFYIGSLSKVMFNGLRLGYIVCPKPLVSQLNEILDALAGQACDSSQLALAHFILDGHLQRHIRRMRRVYKEKRQQMLRSIDSYFPQDVAVSSQNAGLHLTLRWNHALDEAILVDAARQSNLEVRALSYYEIRRERQRRPGVVMGFGNVETNQIDAYILQLADIYKKLCADIG